MIVHSISPFTNPVNSRRSFFSYICGCLEKANVKVDPKIDSLSHSKAYLSSLYLDQFMLRKSPVIYSDKFSSYKHLFESEKNGIWSGLTDNYVKIKHKSIKNLKNQILTIQV